MSNVMLHLYWQAMTCLTLQTNTNCNHLLVTFVTYWSVKVRILWCKTHSYGENVTWWPLSVLFNLQCSFTATHQSWLYIDCLSHIYWLSATGNIDNPLVKGKWQLAFQFERWVVFSVRDFSECYPMSRYLSILLNNIGHILGTAMCWFVIWTDKLNSSVQVCLAGSLHDYLTLLQVHNSFLIFMMRFLLLHEAYSLFFQKKKRKKRTLNTKCSLPCISGRLQCSFFLCVTSQYS